MSDSEQMTQVRELEADLRKLIAKSGKYWEDGKNAGMGHTHETETFLAVTEYTKQILSTVVQLTQDQRKNDTWGRN